MNLKIDSSLFKKIAISVAIFGLIAFVIYKIDQNNGKYNSIKAVLTSLSDKGVYTKKPTGGSLEGLYYVICVEEKPIFCKNYSPELSELRRVNYAGSYDKLRQQGGKFLDEELKSYQTRRTHSLDEAKYILLIRPRKEIDAGGTLSVTIETTTTTGPPWSKSKKVSAENVSNYKVQYHLWDIEAKLADKATGDLLQASTFRADNGQQFGDYGSDQINLLSSLAWAEVNTTPR